MTRTPIPKTRNLGGSTLIEMIVVMTIFGFLSLAIFSLFRLGTQTFALGVARNDLQLQARRCTALFQRELSRSSLLTVGLVPGQVVNDGETLSRDAISFGTLSDWSDSTLFEPVGGLPLWDRYYVFFSTTSTPLGQFGHTTVDPPAVPIEGPWGELSGLFPNIEPPSLGGGFGQVNILSRSVLSFSARHVEDALAFNLVLRGTTEDARRRSEDLQLRFTIEPRNR